MRPGTSFLRARSFFFHPVAHDPRDEGQGKGSVVGELNRPLRRDITGQVVLECRDARRCGIEPDVVPESRKMDEVPPGGKRRNSVRHALYGTRGVLPDDPAHLPQPRTDGRRKRGDVFVNG